MMFVKRVRTSWRVVEHWGGRLFLGLFCAVAVSTSAHAVTIEYKTQYLGGNDWQYAYYVSGYGFGLYQGFQIYFDYNAYSSLDISPSAPNSDWSPITTAADPAIPLDGVYDALAVVNTPSLADPFVVSFAFSGAGNPGSQAFSLYSCDDVACSTGLRFGPSGFTVTRADGGGGSGGGTTPVPEPVTATLVLAGLLGFSVQRRWG